MEIVFLNEDNIEQFQHQSSRQVLALGYFDGLHIGHRKVIQTAIDQAKIEQIPVSVMSFSPHPKVVLSNGKKQVQQLMTLEAKCEKLAKMGVNRLYLVQFTKSFAKLSPEDFILNYIHGLKVKHIVAGFDFTFGYKGQGTLANIAQYTNVPIQLTEVEKVEFCGEKISSTSIRKRLSEGAVADIQNLLGQHYTIDAYWNGSELKQQFQCMLPAPGSYQVRVTCEQKQLETVVMVTTNRHLVVPSRFPSELYGNIRIEWLNNFENIKFEQAQI
ncbi:FAD synthetase family protein [Rummeliibacillus sp. JY-2-4R]